MMQVGGDGDADLLFNVAGAVVSVADGTQAGPGVGIRQFIQKNGEAITGSLGGLDLDVEVLKVFCAVVVCLLAALE